jgi:hypothetical protein
MWQAIAALTAVATAVLSPQPDRDPQPESARTALPPRGATDAGDTLLWATGSFTFFTYIGVILQQTAGADASGVAAFLLVFGVSHSLTAARKLFSRADLDARMTGIAWGRSDAFLDEHLDAYKDVDIVMADAADLATVRHTLHQVVNVKGD